MKITRIGVAALLALAVTVQASAPATAAPVQRTASTCDFWFICC